MMAVLDDAGFTACSAPTASRPTTATSASARRSRVTTRLESVVGPKQTGVGEGYFVTTRNIWRVGDEQVATMLFRVLKFIPSQRSRRALSRPPLGDRPPARR